jgi:hypothetical protein
LVQVLLLIVEGPAATVADGENRRLRGMAMEEHVEEEEEPQDHSATASSLRHCYTIPTADGNVVQTQHRRQIKQGEED